MLFLRLVLSLYSNYGSSVDFNATKASARACLPLDDSVGCRNEINLDFSWFDFFFFFSPESRFQATSENSGKLVKQQSTISSRDGGNSHGRHHGPYFFFCPYFFFFIGTALSLASECEKFVAVPIIVSFLDA